LPSYELFCYFRCTIPLLSELSSFDFRHSYTAVLGLLIEIDNLSGRIIAAAIPGCRTVLLLHRVAYITVLFIVKLVS